MTGSRNTRFIPRDIAALAPENIKNLKLKWAFSFSNTSGNRSQPAIAGGAVFVGDQNGYLYALDADNGCVHWQLKVDDYIRTAISISDWQKRGKTAGDHPLLYFGDASVNAYAVDAVTGQLRWKAPLRDHPYGLMTGAPTLRQSSGGSRLYVPVSSFEEGLAANADYRCCTFRGSVVALDAGSGEIIWRTYVIPTAPTEQSKNGKGVAQFGPSGGGVWNSPTIDEARQRLYVGTGENDSSPTENGGAVVAIDLADGKIAWVFQAYAKEAYNASCRGSGMNGDGSSCPEEFKGRYGLDVSSSPLLIRAEGGQEIIVAAQKPGDVFGLDPDRNGRVLWRRRIARGDYNQGVLFGMAAEGSSVFASVHNKWGTNFDKGPYWGEEELGVYAMDAFTGEPGWMAPVADQCHSGRCQGYAAALTAIPGVVFAGAQDGWLRALDTSSGKVLWEFNTAQAFVAVNGEKAQGGEINGPGPVVVNGRVYLNSGYGNGNAFLVFSVGGK